MIFLTWKYDYAETVKKFIILYENVIRHYLNIAVCQVISNRELLKMKILLVRKFESRKIIIVFIRSL